MALLYFLAFSFAHGAGARSLACVCVVRVFAPQQRTQKMTCTKALRSPLCNKNQFAQQEQDRKEVRKGNGESKCTDRCPWFE